MRLRNVPEIIKFVPQFATVANDIARPRIWDGKISLKISHVTGERKCIIKHLVKDSALRQRLTTWNYAYMYLFDGCG